jgi:hypothetical protein
MCSWKKLRKLPKRESILPKRLVTGAGRKKEN